MNYTFFPGCLLDTIAVPYRKSLEAVFEKLGITVSELHDWNCCGGGTYFDVDDGVCAMLSARNLARAERLNRELIMACNMCYDVHQRAHRLSANNDDVGARIREGLQSIGLEYTGTLKIRHVLEILAADPARSKISGSITHPLTGLKVACYYGCRGLRPAGTGFDDPESPRSMDCIVELLGAIPLSYPHKTTCCGGSLIAAAGQDALYTLKRLLTAAHEHGADCIATSCPMCQWNLDSYQWLVNRAYDMKFQIPVLSITQLLGMALGLPDEKIMLNRSMTAQKVLESGWPGSQG